MFGSVLATVNESLMVARPTTQARITFQANPVIRLTSVAIAIEPLARARDGCCSARLSTTEDCVPEALRVVPPLRVNAALAVHSGLRGPDPADDSHDDQQHEQTARRPGHGDRDDAVGGGVQFESRGLA